MSIAGPASEPPSVAAARLMQNIEAKFADGLKAVRPPCARGPRPGSDQLRLAYLDLLKLCLCDLAGPRTSSVTRTFDGEVMSRELDGEDLRLRSAGMDWPLHGLTMVGLTRLDDLQRCVESIVRDGVEGDLIEAGTWRGGASILMRATLDSLGDADRTVCVADSFQGFPEVNRPGDDGYDLAVDLAAIDFLAVPLEEVRVSFARFGLEHGVGFMPGFFEDTLPQLGDRRWSVVRLDGDTYDATRLSLEALYPRLSAGGYLIVDDYLALDPCREAVDDFRDEHGITEPLDEVDWSCARWRRESEASPRAARHHRGGSDRTPNAGERSTPVRTTTHASPVRTTTHASPVRTTTPASPVRTTTHGRVPAVEEVELRYEMERMQERLAAAEAEIERLAGYPSARLRKWVRRGLHAAIRIRRRLRAAARSRA
jgi:O-methyltransferase